MELNKVQIIVDHYSNLLFFHKTHLNKTNNILIGHFAFYLKIAFYTYNTNNHNYLQQIASINEYFKINLLLQ